MGNLIILPVSKPGDRSKSIEVEIRLKTEAMESARDQIQEVFAKLAVIQDELARVRICGT
ncbi:hypothetical protein ATY78_03645 [Rhizobium sp. R635]|uniref:hypothetical protein n=1 Tax=Rhizobium sp. R635 TaxID=1764275 RepID=UPI000B53317A|nr:hypothetical protein [Rhizobium sp. R635]OWV87604.1 hypothetical protein ATY78_03645 [Rhizobium sp. R635]